MLPKDMTSEVTHAQYLNDELSDAERQAFEAWLVKHPDVERELSALCLVDQQVTQSGEIPIPEPTSQMDQCFYEMLDQETASKRSVIQQIFDWFDLPQVKRVAYATGFAVTGFFIGHYAHLLQQSDDFETLQIQNQQQQIQALAVLSMLDMPSANKRIMAIQLAGMNDMPNEPVFDALLNTLVKDNNVNVRLEALAVLANHTDNDQVRVGLLNAIKEQQSPTLQVALSQLMLALKEKEAIEPIKELIEQPDVLDQVKEQLNQTVEELI